MLLSVAAWAGSGPGVPGAGKLLLYVGADSQRFREVKVNGGPDGPFVLDVGNGVSTIGSVISGSYGFTSRSEFEFTLPFQYSYVHRPEGDVCVLLAAEACDETATVGIIEARFKSLVLDEFAGAPFSLALGATARLGQLTGASRHRITNAGEGTFDLGWRVTGARSGPIGAWFYTVSFDATGVYRLPNTRTWPNMEGDVRAPGPEGWVSGDILVSPSMKVTFGPAALYSIRPSGANFATMIDIGAADADRFAALNYHQFRVGGKLIVSDKQYNSLNVGSFMYFSKL